MKPTTGVIGLAVVAAIFIASFYVYSKLSHNNGSPSSQTATITDFLKETELQTSTSSKVAVNSSSSIPSKPSLSGFKENELKAGLDKIKDSLDLLTNPVD